MDKKPIQLIIIGGGTSISEGIDKKLWERLKGKFVIGINFSYKYFPTSTFLCYLDKRVCEKNIEDFTKMSLVITKKQPKKDHSNELQFPTSNNYTRDLKNGVYKGSLTGIYALTLGIHLLDEGEIFLLGYDYGASKEKDKKGRAMSHFYQGKIEHTGIGKVGYYNNSKRRQDRDFGVYKKEKKVKIYNVSLNSKISTFQKISYDEFFKKLNNKKYNQKELRKFVREKLGIK